MFQKIHSWDRRFLLWIQKRMRKTWLTKILRIVTRLGDGGIIWFALGFYLLVQYHARRTATAMAISLCFSALVNNLILKNLVARIRPFDKIKSLQILIRKPRDFSFPSGHTSSSFAAATVFLGMLPLGFSFFAVGLALMIAFSRLYLGAHYPSDVMCGMALGILFGLVSQKLLMTALDNTWFPETIHSWLIKGRF